MRVFRLKTINPTLPSRPYIYKLVSHLFEIAIEYINEKEGEQEWRERTAPKTLVTNYFYLQNAATNV